MVRTLSIAVGPDGKFTGKCPEFCRGRWVKDCDKDIVRDLKQRGLLFHQEQYVHDYPFCPAPRKTPSSNTRVKAGSSARRNSKTTC